MTVYQALQLNAAGSKALIRQAGEKKEKVKWSFVYLLKILLTVGFCFTFVTVFSLVFGSSNSIAGVAVLLTLLAVRQADFGIRTSHGTVNLEVLPIVGILGGIGVVFSAGYSAQTIFNVLGALTVAVGIFGLYGAIAVRVLANIFGTIYALVYQNIYERIVKWSVS